MKRSLLLLLALAATIATYAQAGGLYIRAGVGYGLPLAGQTIDKDGYPYSGSIAMNTTTNQTSYNVKKASFSSGMQATAALGYMFSQHVGVEVGGNIIAAPTHYTLVASGIPNYSAAYLMNSNIKQFAKAPVFIMPALVYHTGGTGRLQGYARGGVTISLGTKVMEEQSNTWIDVFNSPETLTEATKTKFNVGFTGAMGASYNLGGNVSVWLEGSLLAMSLYASQTTITQHTLDGAASTVPPLSGTTIKYGSTVTASSTSMPTYSMPFSNLGISVGITFGLSKSTAGQSPKSE